MEQKYHLIESEYYFKEVILIEAKKLLLILLQVAGITIIFIHEFSLVSITFDVESLGLLILE